MSTVTREAEITSQHFVSPIFSLGPCMNIFALHFFGVDEPTAKKRFVPRDAFVSPSLANHCRGYVASWNLGTTLGDEHAGAQHGGAGFSERLQVRQRQWPADSGPQAE